MNKIEIPNKLKNDKFRFVKVEKNGKKPFESNWQDDNNYSCDDDELQGWLKEGGNYGVATGFGDLVVIDCDEEEVFKSVKENLPETFTVRTGGGGKHVYYVCDDLKNPIRLTSGKAQGDVGDVQYSGKQVIGPNSMHPNGNKYRVLVDEDIKSVKAENIKFALRKWIKKRKETNLDHPSEESLDIENVIEGINGFRNRHPEYQGAHPVHGSTNGMNFCVNVEKNLWHCFRCDSGGGPVSLVGLLEGFLTCEEKGRNKLSEILDSEEFNDLIELCKDKYDLDVDINLEDGVEERFLDIQKRDDGSIKKIKVDIDEVAEYLLEKHDIKTVFGDKKNFMYFYKEGVWNENSKGILESECENLLKKFARNHNVREIIDKVQRLTQVNREDFEETPEWMTCIENGVLDLRDMNNIKLLPHDKKYNFKSKIPVKYDPDAECDNIEKFIEETFYESDVPQVYEWIGFHLLKRYIFKKAALLQGPTDTGKTVFIKLLTSFIGKENTSNLSLQQIGEGKSFDMLNLKDSRANIYDDLNSKDIKNVGGFKMAVGDGIIAGERKFGGWFNFTNTAKMTFSCNQIPTMKERDVDDAAYYGRWLIWSLERQVPEEEQDRRLIQKLTTDKELSGLLNKALAALKRLIEQNQFTNEKDWDVIKNIMLQSGNSLAKFATHVLVRDEDNKITKGEMYKRYCDFCEDQGLTPVSKQMVGRNLRKFANYVRDSKGGDNKRVWFNVNFKEKKEFLNNLQPLEVISYGEQKKLNNDDTHSTHTFLKSIRVYRNNNYNYIHSYNKKKPVSPVRKNHSTTTKTDSKKNNNSTGNKGVSGRERKEKKILRAKKTLKKVMRTEFEDYNGLIALETMKEEYFDSWPKKLFELAIKELEDEGILFKPKSGKIKLM